MAEDALRALPSLADKVAFLKQPGHCPEPIQRVEAGADGSLELRW